MIRPVLLSALVLLAGCARSEEARYAQIDNSLPPPANLLAEDADEGLTVGTWQSGLDGDRPVLQFGPVGAPALFSIGCDDRRNLLLQRAGVAPPGDLPNMLITVGSETKRLSVAGTGGGNPMLRGTLVANDPFRRVLSEAATRIVVRLGDTQPLVMPPSPLIDAYAEQCAAGTARPAAPEGNVVEANGSVEVVGGNAATANGQ